MAELCIKQGLRAEGVEIYRRLVRGAPDELTRARRQRRLVELTRALGPEAAPATSTPAGTDGEDPAAPALRVRPRGEEIEVEWSLPAETRAPVLQLLFVRRTPAGVETEARTVKLAGPQGRTMPPRPASTRCAPRPAVWKAGACALARARRRAGATDAASVI